MNRSIRRRASRRNAHAQGFTLIELMIVVAVIAILATIAYPSYREHVVKSRRAAAQSCLQEAAQFMERYYTTNLKYVDASNNPPALPNMQCRTDLSNFYNIRVAAADAKSYRLEAAPEGGQQDPKCGTLSVTQTGVKGATGSAGVAQCW